MGTLCEFERVLNHCPHFTNFWLFFGGMFDFRRTSPRCGITSSLLMQLTIPNPRSFFQNISQYLVQSQDLFDFCGNIPVMRPVGEILVVTAAADVITYCTCNI